MPEQPQTANPKPDTQDTPMLEVREAVIGSGDFLCGPLSLNIPQGDGLVLMGKTGCGKTTLMETICGLREIKSGVVRIAGQDVSDLPPRKRGIGYVPQDVALFQSLSVYENLAFALRVKRWKSSEIEDCVRSLAEDLQIADLLERAPRGLSGGEAKRVVIGRALAARPALLCLDEPLSALDEETHDTLCALLRKIIETENVTALVITHDPEEARLLGDHVVQWKSMLNSESAGFAGEALKV